METAETSGDCREQWRLQRAVETAESNGDCREQWRLQRVVETAESSGDCREQWKLQRPVGTAETGEDGSYNWRLLEIAETIAETRGELLKPVEDAKTDGDCWEHDKLTTVSNQNTSQLISSCNQKHWWCLKHQVSTTRWAPCCCPTHSHTYQCCCQSLVQFSISARLQHLEGPERRKRSQCAVITNCTQ